MKFLLNLLLFLSFSYAVSEEYISEFQANVKMIREYNISEIEKFRSYQLIGTFTDEYGNYGKFDAIITSDIKKNKLIKLEGTAINVYSNEETLYARAYRKESDFDAGVANMEIIGASEKFKPLIGTKCIQSVRYFKDTIFGMQKCIITKEQSDILKNN
ncbi:hypothetical protein N9R86_01435 [Alphaproteobacteria bacterium]|nr:hypothetical protein [Alphaproteobacteria bacterium]